MIKEEEIKSYTKYAKNNGFNYILLCKDLEDQEIFPVYFPLKEDMIDYENCLISESKIKIVDRIVVV
jgi:hypothetical protein